MRQQLASFEGTTASAAPLTPTARALIVCRPQHVVSILYVCLCHVGDVGREEVACGHATAQDAAGDVGEGHTTPLRCVTTLLPHTHT